MSLKLKAFIYRFSNIFGLHIYLAEKEEVQYLASLRDSSSFELGMHIGLWQAKHGFTTVYVGRKSFLKGIYAKIKHAFGF
jgi:hypothetical protein